MSEHTLTMYAGLLAVVSLFFFFYAFRNGAWRLLLWKTQTPKQNSQKNWLQLKVRLETQLAALEAAELELFPYQMPRREELPKEFLSALMADRQYREITREYARLNVEIKDAPVELDLYDLALRWQNARLEAREHCFYNYWCQQHEPVNDDPAVSTA